MTEYDFSPEAYEKYLATQARIATWVDHTRRTKLVDPYFPPTPLYANGDAQLPHTRDRKSHSARPSPAPSPPPDQSQKSKNKKRSKSSSTPRRVPTPFVPTPELPEPGCPVYNRNWDTDVPSAPRAAAPSPEPTLLPTTRERKRPHPRPNPDWPADFVPTPGLPEPGCPVYWPGPGKTSDDTFAEGPYRPPHPATRKRSMSFSATASRPLDHSPPALQHYNSSSPHYEPTHSRSGYWPSHHSSPNQPYSSSVPLMPPAHTPASAPFHPTQNFKYPLPHQQYPDYDAARRREPVRSRTVPAHASHYSMDSMPYSYTTPGYSHQRSRPTEIVHQSQEQHHQQHQRQRLPSGPVTTTETHSGSVRVTFPNGKTLYMTPPNSNRAEILKHPDQYQVPYSYYMPPKKPPLLKRLFTGFSKNSGGSSTKSSEAQTQSAQSSPTRKTVRKRRSSFSL